ncbi:MAG: hypothetical protein R6U04_10725, partial [Bacteroidales bacterium]
MYTFKDWLNGNIKEKAPGGTNLVDDTDNGLTMLYGHYKLIDKANYNKILEAKKWAYDTALNYSLESYKKHIYERLNKCEDKKEFLRLEIQETNKILEKNPKEYKSVIGGGKKYMTIRGVEYKKIKEQYERYKQGKNAIRMLFQNTDKEIQPNTNYLVKFNYEVYKWLKELAEQEPQQKEEEPLTFKEF